MDNVYSKHGHGTSCSSIILSSFYGDYDTLVGTAPAANMVFIRTEDPLSEQLIEEDFWVAGAELADSLGADVITASLGYTRFDDTTFVFDYSSCDGRTSVASLAATMAAHKGMIVCVAAGNDGENEWHKLSRPSDAEDILCVGAVNVDSLYAPFSSCGPSYDGRVKPDVVSCGWDCYMVYTGTYYDNNANNNLYSYISTGNGTSCATPTLAGLAACLWQALPELTSLEVMQLIREAGHQYEMPDTSMGYGIPDFYRIFVENYVTDTTDTTGIAAMQIIRNELNIYPNPVGDRLTIENTGEQNHTIYIYDLSGKMIDSTEVNAGETTVMDATKWSAGIYLLQANSGKGRPETVKIIRH
jgi:subtilisin family serine protease